MAYGHRSFLVLGESSVDISSLINGGLEILDCDFSFHQGIDNRGKASTKTKGGVINVILSQLPSTEIIEWSLNTKKYKDGIIVILNEEQIPIEKIIFQNACCVNFSINYTQNNDSYAATRLKIVSEKITVGNGVNFDNEWIY